MWFSFLTLHLYSGTPLKQLCMILFKNTVIHFHPFCETHHCRSCVFKTPPPFPSQKAYLILISQFWEEWKKKNIKVFKKYNVRSADSIWGIFFFIRFDLWFSTSSFNVPLVTEIKVNFDNASQKKCPEQFQDVCQGVRLFLEELC